MEQHPIQRTRQNSARKAQLSQDFSDQEEYDDIWPTRMPSSARRYYSSDVSTNDSGRVRGDAQSQALNEYPSTRPGRRSSIPARSTATQPNNVTTTPARRTSTQSHIPTTAPTTRRAPTTNIPAVQNPRRTTTSNVPTAPNSRRTTTGNVSTMPNARRTTTGNVPMVRPSQRRAIGSSEVTTRGKLAPAEAGQRKLRFHWLFYVGVAMLAMTLLWGAFSVVNTWWQNTYNDVTYGRPRTYQTDQVVGHNDSSTHPSHFIALNLNSHIEIIEFPGGDPTKAKIYIGPPLTGPGQDLTPVTLEFKDVNGDGKPDMIVKVQASRFVFINSKGGFRPLHPGEAVHL